MRQQANLNLETNFLALRQAFSCDSKFVTISAGRRSGKTFEAFDWLHYDLLNGLSPNAIWIDTVNKNIDKYVERYCMTRLRSIWNIMRWDKQKKVLTYPNGAYIDFGSSESPENLEGFEYGRMVINEAGIALKRSSLWDNTLQPMTKGVNNKTRFVGTPKGKNKFFDLDNMGRQGNPQFASYHFTAYESPYWDKSELDFIKTNVPQSVWNQEYLAQFLDNNAGVFSNIQGCVRSIVQLDKGIPGRKYAMGIDLAKHTDFTVIIVMDLQTNEVVYIDRFNQIDYVFQKRKILEVWERFNKCNVLMDSTGVGDPVYDDLYRVMYDKIQGYKLTNATKKDLIEGLSLALESTLLYYSNNEQLIAELESYEYEITRSGNITYNAPEGLHDDMVIALALVWQLAKPDSSKYGFFVI